MIPFLARTGGSCQDAVIPVDERTTKVKLSGDLEGTATRDKLCLQTICTTENMDDAWRSINNCTTINNTNL